MILRRDLGLPVRLDHHGLMRLDDQGRASNAMAWLESDAQEDRRVMPVATGEEPRLGLRFRQLVDRKRQVGLVRMLSAAKRLDLDRLDLDRLVGADKAEALAVHRLETQPADFLMPPPCVGRQNPLSPVGRGLG